jgi:Ser/Thr protein kinase RdoA (MazF antagonist)
MYDLAVAVAHCIGTPDHSRFWAALLQGYGQRRNLPDAQISQFDLLSAAFYVYFILWMVGIDHLHPGCLDQEMEHLKYRGAAFILRYLE